MRDRLDFMGRMIKFAEKTYLKPRNYTEVMEYLYTRLPMFQKQGGQALKPKLDNIQAFCKALGHPETKFKSVHVAGTNGKGSTCHLLAAILQAAGYKVGLHTSPHLVNFTERIKVNGEEAPKDWVVAFVQQHFELIESRSPSFFEVSVAMAFQYFAEANLDITVVEVGLGGRWDSTNVIQPLVAHITNISFDHKDILGDTLPQIASEKAGIIKQNTPVVISEKQAETVDVFLTTAAERQAPIFFAEDQYRVESQQGDVQTVWRIYKDENLILKDIQPFLLGEHQQKNLQGVLNTIDLLKTQGFQIDPKHIKKGTEQLHKLVKLKGRWQTLAQKPTVVCDVAHNEAGIYQVANLLKKTPYQALHLVLGFAKDKDLQAMLKLFPREAFFYFCTFNSPRAQSVEELKISANFMGIKGLFFDDVNTALQNAKKNAKENDLIFIGGSTFVVAELDFLVKE